MFQEYLRELVENMKVKYPNRKIVLVMDNLWAHKSSLTLHQFDDDEVLALYTPSNTPQFSPVENMFGFMKKKIKDYQF